MDFRYNSEVNAHDIQQSLPSAEGNIKEEL